MRAPNRRLRVPMMMVVLMIVVMMLVFAHEFLGLPNS
jgi:hypothetical protein